MIFAVLNGLSLMHLSSKMQAMSLQAGVPFGMAAKFGSTLIDEQVLLGYMVILTPALAWGLLNMATTSVVGAFQGVAGGFQGIAQQIGGQQAQGDENIGNVHMDTSSIGNSTRNVTSANKYDTAGLFRTGSTTIEQGTGSSFTNFDNGLITRADTQSSLGFAMSSQSAIEKDRGRRYLDWHLGHQNQHCIRRPGSGWRPVRLPSQAARSAVTRSARAMRRPKECMVRRRKPWTSGGRRTSSM
ncbi:conjugal transfer protein TraG N-terminal domain-containing protein [Burkholderia glumae]|uniref:conjugal transfer protein TraG N-terminal domain-containing protein n=1 Tax=Burkholderia glumae TaxID=337 RepID=UPI00214FB1A7|nr:conjugal transfer protein TraG N-terminal domain-containing protein [Burkholderia glumae]